MGFENRGNQKYYYRKHRRNGTVYSEYVGGGELAFLIAQLDEFERQEKELEHLEFEDMRQREDSIDDQLKGAEQLIKAITGICLVASGYHQHHRQWRKWRKKPT